MKSSLAMAMAETNVPFLENQDQDPSNLEAIISENPPPTSTSGLGQQRQHRWLQIFLMILSLGQRRQLQFPPPTSTSGLGQQRQHMWLKIFLGILSFHESWWKFLPFLVWLGGVLYALYREELSLWSIVRLLLSHVVLVAAPLIGINYALARSTEDGFRGFLYSDRPATLIEARFIEQYNMKKKRSMILLGFLWVFSVISKGLFEYFSEWKTKINLFSVIVFGGCCYATAISLTANVLFGMICSFQVVHYEHFVDLWKEPQSDLIRFYRSHNRLIYRLSIISQRFQLFLLLQLIVGADSVFFTLFQLTGGTPVAYGDFMTSSAIQLIGIIMCLSNASEISHYSQDIVAEVSSWHAEASCNTGNQPPQPTHQPQSTSPSPSSVADVSAPAASGSSTLADSSHRLLSAHTPSPRSDLETMNSRRMPIGTPASAEFTYLQRQALIVYLENNPGGITIYGWTVDRTLLETIFFFMVSIVTFVLGRAL